VKLVGLSVLILVGLSLGASDVRADSFVITGGSANVRNISGGLFHLLGDDVELNGGMNFGPDDGPFRAGETVIPLRRWPTPPSTPFRTPRPGHLPTRFPEELHYFCRTQ
jgi:hypothetical protein